MTIKKLIKNKIPFIVMRYMLTMQNTSLINGNWCVCSIKPENEIKRIIKKHENDLPKPQKPSKDFFVKIRNITKGDYKYFRENLHLFNKKNVPDGTIYEPKGIETLKERVNKWT